MKTYQIKSFGCKVNQYEAQQISEFLQKLGLQAAKPAQRVDLAVVHSCAVTSRAMSKSRQALRRFLRQKTASVVASGCGARWAQAELGRLEPAVKIIPKAQDIGSVLSKIATDQAVPNDRLATINQGSKASGRDKQCMIPTPAKTTVAASNPIGPLSNHIQTTWVRQVKSKVYDDGLGQKAALGPIKSFSGHQRAFVKVQDGCDAFCSYCVVPYLRPKLSWRGPEDVLKEISQLVQNGYREVVLSGVHLGAYGQETTARKDWNRQPAASLAGLLGQVAAIEGLERVRLSSLEPGEVSVDLLEVMAGSTSIAKHLHLPLQSGSEKILKRMNRRYGPVEYIETIDKARGVCEEMTITTDVIAGFPGETDEDFQSTMAVAEQVQFGRTHVFEFSARKGTAAAGMSGQVPKRIRQQRSRQMRQLGDRLARQYQKSLIGQRLRVLVEGRRNSQGFQAGLCEQYFSVGFESKEKLAGRLVPVLLEEVDEFGARGRLISHR